MRGLKSGCCAAAQWHWTSQCLNHTNGTFSDHKHCIYNPDAKSVQYNRGAVEFPKLLAKVRLRTDGLLLLEAA